MNNLAKNLTPKEIVSLLDKHIIGQSEAKKAVAIAMRNRWRRMEIPENFRKEVVPKNMLLIGPTGVGKTEISRRLAKLVGAPFIKIEATKYTEVGYVGRDVEQMIRDLVESSIKMTRKRELQKVKDSANAAVEERILDCLLPRAKSQKENNEQDMKSVARDTFRKMLREGKLDDKEIDIDVVAKPVGVEIMAPPGMEEMTNQLQSMLQNMGNNKKKRRRIKIKVAKKTIYEEEANKLIDEEEIKNIALYEAENNGVIVIDEIDKIARGDDRGGNDVSRSGVQRDLLPLIEGCAVNTKYGTVQTDHILFIASGAFHLSKPSDLIPELQGRLPIRVKLPSLKISDFKRILVEPDFSLTKQYHELFKTEGIEINFEEDAIDKIAKLAWEINEQSENIGARRLYTIMEKLFESLSFDASDLKDQKIIVNAQYVDDNLGDLIIQEDLSQYIL